MEDNLELKIYKTIGVVKFKNLVMKLRQSFLILLSKFFKEEEDKEEILNNKSNYRLKNGNGIKDLKDFKKWILVNASIHTIGLILCIIKLNILLTTKVPLNEIIDISIVTLINLYCLMLQRYNNIRINNVIKKEEPKEYAKTEKLKENLLLKSKSLINYTYKSEDKELTFEEILEKASLKELLQYKKTLEYLKDNNEDTTIHLKDKQIIKLELKKN